MKQAKVKMPPRLLSPEGDAWMLRCRLLKEAFDNRNNGNFFARNGEIEDAYAKLSPAKFMERFA